MTDTQPRFADLVKITANGWDGIPDSPMPYYLGAKDGLFIHRRLLFGRGIARVEHWPENFHEAGSRTGRFRFEADPIPAKIMSQIVSFFQRIYALQKSEAAVLLTMHTETKEWSVFVPTQLVSHGGVNYVYDPQHIAGGRIVVGSIHSHADFSPFHSGTDTGDAADFDGIHGTIGFVNTNPKIVMMVSMNKQNMDFGEADFPYLFDWSEIGQHEAPTWWDQYVGTAENKGKPVGHELYKKFERPTEIKNHALVIHQGGAARMQNNWGIPANQRTYEPWWAKEKPQDLIRRGYAWDATIQSYKWVGKPTVPMTDPSATLESAKFNIRKAAERGVDWDSDTGALSITKLSKKEAALVRKSLEEDDAQNDPWWEDTLPEQIVIAITTSACITEDDLDYAATNIKLCGTIEYWQKEFVEKAIDAVSVLQALGINAQLKLTTAATHETPEQEWLLPETPTQQENASNAVH